MNMQLAAFLAFCGLLPLDKTLAQGVDPDLAREVAAVRAELARSNAALLQYAWTEHMDVLVSGQLQSSTDATCRYDAGGQLTRTPAGSDKESTKASDISKRPLVRSKAGMQDYVNRAVNTIYDYVPINPKQLDFLLETGHAFLGRPTTGRSEVRFENYYQTGDSLIFSYEPESKRLIRVIIVSTLGDKKDPVTLEAVYEPLPDGANHLASATLLAKKKNVQVKMQNVGYQKAK